MRYGTFGIAGLIFLAACSTSTSSSATCTGMGASAIVSASDANTFSPANPTITHGQTVCWENTGSVGHTVTDDGGAFNASLASGATFTHVYALPGVFPYHCTIHAGMVGAITVN